MQSVSTPGKTSSPPARSIRVTATLGRLVRWMADYKVFYYPNLCNKEIAAIITPNIAINVVTQ